MTKEERKEKKGILYPESFLIEYSVNTEEEEGEITLKRWLFL